MPQKAKKDKIKRVSEGSWGWLERDKGRRKSGEKQSDELGGQHLFTPYGSQMTKGKGSATSGLFKAKRSVRTKKKRSWREKTGNLEPWGSSFCTSKTIGGNHGGDKAKKKGSTKPNHHRQRRGG